MKLAWRWSQHSGGFSNIGSGASPNSISEVASAPPRTYPSLNITSPNVWVGVQHCRVIEGDLVRIPLAYTSGPAVRA